FFFRHFENEKNKKAYNAFIDELIKNMPRGEDIRVLSAGCSTGEQAYTIAMILLEKGVPPERIHVVGVDIEPDAIASAEHGVYSGKPLKYLLGTDLINKYFSEIDDQSYEIKQKIKDLVDFQVCDLTDTDEMAKLGKFDGVVFTYVAYQIPVVNKRIMAYRNIEMTTKDGGFLFADSNNGRRVFVRTADDDGDYGTRFRVHIAELEMEKNVKSAKRKKQLSLGEYREPTIKALEATRGHSNNAAIMLGISPSAMTNRITRIRKDTLAKGDRSTLKRIERALSYETERRLCALEETENVAKASERLGIRANTLDKWIRWQSENGNRKTKERIKKQEERRDRRKELADQTPPTNVFLPTLSTRLWQVVPVLGTVVAFITTVFHEGLHLIGDLLTGGFGGRVVIKRDKNGYIEGKYVAGVDKELVDLIEREYEEGISPNQLRVRIHLHSPNHITGRIIDLFKRVDTSNYDSGKDFKQALLEKARRIEHPLLVARLAPYGSVVLPILAGVINTLTIYMTGIPVSYISSWSLLTAGVLAGALIIDGIFNTFQRNPLADLMQAEAIKDAREQGGERVIRELDMLPSENKEDKSDDENVTLEDLNLKKKELIGEGYYAKLFKVPHKTTGKFYVLKRYHFGFSPHYGASVGKITEHLLGLSKNHNDLIDAGVMPRYYTEGIYNRFLSTRYVIEDYVPGQNLNDFLRNRPKRFMERGVRPHKMLQRTQEENLHLMISIAKAVSEYHKSGLLLKELTPANIMVRPDLSVCFVDQDSVVPIDYDWVGDPDSISRRIRMMWTPTFSESSVPFSWNDGEELKRFFTAQWDIYSLGLCAYAIFDSPDELKALRENLPLVDFDREALVQRVRNRTQEIMPDERSLYDIISKCIDLDRSKRYEDVDSVIRDLEAYRKTMLGA
ncbi:MAG: CheR family methyltransferase, partial [Candidatus Omnitrophota bacterium]